MSKKLLKEPTETPPKHTLEVLEQPQNAGGSASRKEDVRDDLSDIRKFGDRSPFGLGERMRPELKKKFPLGEQ